MNSSLTLTKLGGIISSQDLGRSHVQHLGFGASGACDEYAFLSGNHALGNALSAPALELFIFTDIAFKVNNACRIFISGADSNAKVNDKGVVHWHPLSLKKGDELKLQRPLHGKITYLAIAGGFNIEKWLGSASQNVNEKSLGTSVKIEEGDEFHFEKNIPLSSVRAQRKNNRPSYPWYNFYSFSSLRTSNTGSASQYSALTLRFIPSQLFLDLPLHEQNKLLQQSYDIKPESNRMGYRLQSKMAIDFVQQEKLLSKPVTYGTVQLPPNGQPIVLMKDRQTIGGYPVLGVVIQTDLFRLSQCHTGDKVSFYLTDLAFAQQQLQAFYLRFKPNEV